jgi:4-diphosphocytidyl-2-C-methyl-D-erythritol kinase
MTEAVETARAKINLTLRIHGRRSDGYHELESLVAFAAEGDRLALRPAAPGTFSLAVGGHHAGAIIGDNLVETAWRLFAEAAPDSIGARVTLDKRLPVAAGIGGGSADAAALLRAAARAFPDLAERVNLAALARRLGADVPVCIGSTPALMAGTGERLQPVALPRLDIVLVNSGAAVPTDKTRAVFAALSAPPLGNVTAPEVPRLADVEAVARYARAIGNDLERAAMSVLPEIDAVKQAVGDSRHCLHAALSGAGPTVIGLYPSPADAAAAAAAIGRVHPGWWVCVTELGGSGGVY